MERTKCNCGAIKPAGERVEFVIEPAPEPAEQDGLTPATVAEQAIAKGLVFEWTGTVNGGAGGWYLYDEWRLNHPKLAAPMFAPSLGILVELIGEYDVEKKGLTIYGGSV